MVGLIKSVVRTNIAIADPVGRKSVVNPADSITVSKVWLTFVASTLDETDRVATNRGR